MENVWLGIIISAGILGHSNGNLTATEHEIELLIGTCKNFDLVLSQPIYRNISVSLIANYPDIVHVNHNLIKFPASNASQRQTINICGNSAGHALVNSTVFPNIIRRNDAFIDASVYKYYHLHFLSWLCGWVYFSAWSISFYPQLIINYKRQSVVGLNFDFLTLNVIGYLLYSIFNCGLYWIPFIQNQYFQRHPRGLNPIQLNDVGFSVHALVISVVTIAQCFIYERGEQTVSIIARIIMLIYTAILVTSGVFVYMRNIDVLDFLYVCSYIKLSITLIKYIPQVLMNYRRKSTIGWSIGNVICDFIGGILSMLQMIVISYNYDDWISIFGDLTKFGLGLFSIMFDIIFLLQHYVFYRHSDQSDIQK